MSAFFASDGGVGAQREEDAIKNRASDSRHARRVVEEGYNRIAQAYARLEGEIDWPRMRWLQKLVNRLEPGSSILDLGCGSGVPADVEIAKQHRVTGVDVSQTQIDLARRNVPTGCFLHGDAATVEFAADSFDAVISFYALEHIPRNEHATILRRIYKWLRAEGFLLIGMEAGEYDDVIGEWLGVPMFFSCFDPETMKHLIDEAGFGLLESAVEVQAEGSHEVPYLWLLARKRPGEKGTA